MNNLSQPDFLKHVSVDPLCCRCHHGKHFGRCQVNAGTLQHCLCERFTVEPFVFAAWKAIAHDFLRRVTHAT